MDIKWCNETSQWDDIILAGDIGGTNTNLALLGQVGSGFEIIVECVFPSKDITNLLEPLKKTLEVAKEKNPQLVPTKACICGAGPVNENYCTLTNCTWDIDGNQLSQDLGIPLQVINDFLAISYGVLTLDHSDPSQIHPLTHLDGSTPEPKNSTKLVVGPGTGLGVSYLVWDGSRYIPSSSEGGHMTFPPYDSEMKELAEYMERTQGVPCGAELFVSGTGMGYIYNFYKDSGKAPNNEAWQKIEDSEPRNRPKLISMASDSDEAAANLMRLFTRMLARYCSDASALLLPYGGLYLAGGIAGKDMRWFERDQLFMQLFEKNYNSNIRPLLKKVPVYIVKNYSISLHGAANAAVHLIK
ncbi:MAG: glucokinase [Planctomycetes bacterium]|nr:glucokinase [Planctomycetota bacterium]